MSYYIKKHKLTKIALERVNPWGIYDPLGKLLYMYPDYPSAREDYQYISKRKRDTLATMFIRRRVLPIHHN